jgi:hypothetical protein
MTATPEGPTMTTTPQPQPKEVIRVAPSSGLTSEVMELLRAMWPFGKRSS